MAREITSVKDAELIDSVDRPSNFKERLVKLIPSEIVTAYVTISGIIAVIEGSYKNQLLWATMVILMIITPFYLAKISGVTKKSQILFSTISFAIWAFATAPPEVSGWTSASLASIASVLLIIQTLLTPLFYKG